MMFARRTNWNLATNRYSEAIEAHRRSGRPVLDLTASNPTTIGLHYDSTHLLAALANSNALTYEPVSKGLLTARVAVSSYYRERSAEVDPERIVLTTSTSEGYTFAFRFLCEPGDEVLVPTPSYPLFEFLADLQDVKLVPYELVYDHGWQIDFPSLRKNCSPHSRAVIVVHPNNPTGSYVKTHEAAELSRLCAERDVAIIADEVFLDYSLGETAKTFAANDVCLTLTLSGLSKISGLPQMKVAWLAVSGPEVVRNDALARLDVIADTYLSMNAPVQHAVPTMLEERSSIQQQLTARIRANLGELDHQLASAPAISRLEIEGGWYALLRVPATRTDEDLAIELLQQLDVLVQPGLFYDFHRDGYLVISLITPDATFRHGVERVLRHIDGNR
ncbi:MAG TPA: pyridoxal phosphate-dependent aminotransferase [Candidatus Koribacter sp.]|jgi:aspartate/methionine/tyrosine aminotransferase